uniref:Uncharacterized protein n=1 Tax=Rhizophora mucronata TaxID=61149 RepID=A0A2P2NLC0_RHIMU
MHVSRNILFLAARRSVKCSGHSFFWVVFLLALYVVSMVFITLLPNG